MDDYEDYRTSSINNQNLISLHRLLKKSKHVHHRIQASWIQMIDEAFYLEDVLNNEETSNHIFYGCY